MGQACATAESNYEGIEISQDGQAALLRFATDQGPFEIEIPQQDLHLLAARALQLCAAALQTRGAAA